MPWTQRILIFCLLCFFPFHLWADEGAILRDYIPEGRVTRFEGPILVWLGGSDRLEGKYYVETVLAELGRLVPGLRIAETTSKSQAGICVYLTDSHEEWRETLTRTTEGGTDWQEEGQYVRGATRIFSDARGRIRRADIVLHLDFQTSGGQKLWVVRHEFMHALGVMHHPTAAPDSVLNSRQDQADKNGCFADSDIFVLRTLYRPDVAAGQPLP